MVFNGTSGVALWAVNGVLALVIAICGFDISREFKRNDEQERRIVATEMAIGKIEVKLDYIAKGIDDLKAKGE
jgi:hypothetical protein